MRINNLLKIYSKKHSTPLQLNFLKNYNKFHQKNKLLEQSKFLKEELSIRLSHRVFDLLELPYGLPLIPSIKEVIDLYCLSFNKIQNTKVNCDDDITKFTNILIDIKNNHDHLEDSISKGLLLLNKEVDSSLINYDLINKELDKFFLSRISIRTLITQHTEIVNKNESIITDCNLKNILKHSVDDVKYVCERIYGDKPNIKLLNDEDIIFPYIPSHIYYITNEILKNSCVAYFSKSNFDDDIIVNYSEGKDDIIIKISDKGESFPLKDIGKILTYSYSSTPIEIIEEYEIANKPIICGLGYGLPMAKLYTKYFGGNLLISPIENVGTDIYIYINKFGNIHEKFI